MSKETIKFLKVRDVKSPHRAYPTDAGIDFFVPKFNKVFINDLKTKNVSLFSQEFETIHSPMFGFDQNEGKIFFVLRQNSRVLIPSGLHVRMATPGRALIAANKSGVTSNHGLIFGAQVIDYSYKGEIHLGIINTSCNTVKIYEDMKIIQFIETPIFMNDINVTEDPMGFYDGVIDDRKADGFGSTNK